MALEKHFWNWQELSVAWTIQEHTIDTPIATLFIHGFGACKEHWRHNQKYIGKITQSYAIDLIGFGESSQPSAKLKDEQLPTNGFEYCFDNWSKQIEDFCKEIIKKPVILVGNSIGGVIALNSAKNLGSHCKGIIGIDCAQRTMDDKRLSEQTILMQIFRPFLKQIVRQRFISKNLFHNLANPKFIEKILKIAYPTGKNIDTELINLLSKATLRSNASEAFRGFINLFDDYLAPEIMKDIRQPVDLIWGENDPWEPLEEAERWYRSISCIRSLNIIPKAGHCPHDESPEIVNPILIEIIQDAI